MSHAAVLACFFLLREIEPSHLRVLHVALDYDACTVILHLSVSKTGPIALGCHKTWGCVCNGSLDKPYPFHAAAAAVEDLIAEFGVEAVESMPLFPNAEAGIASKEAVVQALEVLVESAGGPGVGQRRQPAARGA